MRPKVKGLPRKPSRNLLASLLALVIMFGYLFDAGKLNLPIAFNGVDRAVTTAQPNRPLALSLSLQRFVVIAGNLTNFVKPVALDGVNPGFQLVHDVAGDLLQSPLRGL